MNNTLKIVPLMPPAANMFAGTVVTAPLDLSNYAEASIVVYRGMGEGASDIIVEACDENGLNSVPLEFRYQEILAGQGYTLLAQAETNGIITTGVPNTAYMLVINSQALALSGHNFIRIKAVETEKAATFGCIIAVLTSPRFSN